MLQNSPSKNQMPSAPIDLLRVRKLFSSPQKLAASDFLRREVASRMLERLDLIKIQPQRILDAGCGEGADLPLLQQRFPGAHLLGLDASPAMLAQVRGRQHTAGSPLAAWLQWFGKWRPGKPDSAGSADLLCADFAAAPLGLATAGLIWSNLALHWHPYPDTVLAEWRRLLQVEGLLMFSCFGPDTFRQLRDAFAAAGQTERAVPFVDMHDFGDMLVNQGFSTPVMDMETITVTYPNAGELINDVRAWGGNPLATRPRSLQGKAGWQRAMLALERNRQADGRLPLSFEVIYGHAFKPEPRVTAGGESIIRFMRSPSQT